MLYLLFSMIILLPVFAGVGGAVQKISGPFLNGISGKVVAGILTVAVLYTFLAFFIPLSLLVEIIALITGVALFFYLKIYREFVIFFAAKGLAFYSVLAAIVFFGSGYPFILDHFGYYVPTVKWIAEVGMVQGISNLDLLLGQTSVWHILQAGFSHFSDPFLRMNVLMSVVYLIYIFEKKSWVHLVFLPFLFLFIQSPSPDLPAMMLSLIILNESLDSNKKHGWLFTISVFVFALKPTMIWLPVFSFLILVFSLKPNLKVLIPGTALLLLFLFKNVWTFGFPLFPLQIFDLNLAWKPNPELLRNSSELALEKAYDMHYRANEIRQFSVFTKIDRWLFLPGIKGVIHGCFAVSLILFLGWTLKKNSKTHWLLFISVLLKCVLVVLFSAQYRFFLDVFFVIFFVIFYKKCAKNLAVTAFTLLSLSVATFLSVPKLLTKSVPSFKLGNFMTGFTKEQWYKPARFELKKFKTYTVGNLKFNVVHTYPFSFDTPLPAISPSFIREDLEAGIFPQLKGKSLKEGFIWREVSNEEKAKIQKILDGLNQK